MANQNPVITSSFLEGVSDPNVTTGKILIASQIGAAGTATLDEIIEITNLTTAQTLLGLGSPGYIMYETIKRVNELSPIFIWPMTEPIAGVASTANIAVSGTATEAKTITIAPFSERLGDTVSIIVNVGDTSIEVATAIHTAIVAVENAMPLNSDNTTPSEVDLTSDNVGVIGNFMHLSISENIAGLTFVLTGWAGGTGDVDLTIYDTLLGNIRYKFQVFQSGVNGTEIKSVQETRLNVVGEVQDYASLLSTVNDEITIRTLAEALNTVGMMMAGWKPLDIELSKGNSGRTMPAIWNSMLAGIMALLEFDGANVVDFNRNVTNKFPTGGIEMSGQPIHNTPFTFGMPVLKQTEIWDNGEGTRLNASGVFFWLPNRNETETILGQAVTTRSFNDLAVKTDELLYFEFYRRFSIWRELRNNGLSTRFAQSGLTGGVSTTDNVADRNDILAFDEVLYDVIVAAGLMQGGAEEKTAYKNSRVLEIEPRGFRIFTNAKVTDDVRRIFDVVQVGQVGV